MTILMFMLKNWKPVIALLCGSIISFSGGKVLGVRLGTVEGKKSCVAEYELKTSKDYVKKSENSRRVRHEINKFDNAAIDSVLSHLGIMRDPSDY